MDTSSGIFTVIFQTLAALGLSLSAGVRAYLPVLALGIASHLGKIGEFQVKLRPEFAWVGEWWFIGLLALLTLYEISADKIPVVDHINDTVHTIIRPLSGALIFVATPNFLTDAGSAGVLGAALLGAGLAGTTHAAKAAVVRPASTATTMGIANPIISVGEDILVIITTFLSLVIPVIGAALFILLGFLIARSIRQMMKRRQARAAANNIALSGGMPPMRE